MKIKHIPAKVEVRTVEIEPERIELEVSQAELAVIHALVGSIGFTGNKSGNLVKSSVDGCLARFNQPMDPSEFEKTCQKLFQDTFKYGNSFEK
jgi:hypothetical protein